MPKYEFIYELIILMIISHTKKIFFEYVSICLSNGGGDLLWLFINVFMLQLLNKKKYKLQLLQNSKIKYKMIIK